MIARRLGNISFISTVLTGYTNIGSISISGNIASGFSSSKYLKLPEPFPSDFNTLDVIVKAYVSVNTSDNAFYGNSNLEFYVQGASKKANLYNRSGGTSPTGQVISAEATYWFHLRDTGSVMTGYSLLSASQTLDTLPELCSSGWNRSFSGLSYSSQYTQKGDYGLLGYTNPWPAEYWRGSIDLSGCAAYVDGQMWWRAVK